MEKTDHCFDDKFRLFQDYLKSESPVESYSFAFSKFNENEEKVKFAYDLLLQSKLPNLLSSNCKSKEVSIDFREKGNSLFLKKSDVCAIKCYSVSVSYAPSESEELAIAYANRSAVSFSLKDYSASIKDMERALAGEYPQHLRYKLFERQGKCLKILGKNDKAQEAFQKALEFLSHSGLAENKIESLSLSMKKLIQECPSTNKQHKEESKCLPCLQDRSNVILSASALLRIEYSVECGRYVVANADIEPGEVLVVEEPFASVLLPEMYNTHCFHCKKRCHALIPCQDCVSAMYCSELCLSTNYKESHRVECKLIPQLIGLNFTKMELIAVRTLLIATYKYGTLNCFIESARKMKSNDDPRTNGLNENGQYVSSDYYSVHHMVDNRELRLNADIFRRATVAAYIIWLLENCTEYFTIYNVATESIAVDKHIVGGLLLKYLMVVASNAHEVSEMLVRKGEKQNESVEVGGALYPVISLLNHSCDPNVVRHSHNGELNVLTAIQRIRAGEEVCDNYGYHHAIHDLSSRQNKLRDQYLFICQCIACKDDWPTYDKLPDSLPTHLKISLKEEVEKSSEIFQDVLADVQSKKTEGKLGFLYAHLALLHRAIKRPWKEYSACQEAIKQCLGCQANHYVVQ